MPTATQMRGKESNACFEASTGGTIVGFRFGLGLDFCLGLRFWKWSLVTFWDGAVDILDA